MKYHRIAEANTPECRAFLDKYDQVIQRKANSRARLPRHRSIELFDCLRRVPEDCPDTDILDTGSFNTFIGIWLAEYFKRPIISDLLYLKLYKSIARRTRILRYKPTEIEFFRWYITHRKAARNIRIRNIDLTNIKIKDESLDIITCISTIEHVPDTRKAIAEIVRCLRRNGRALITTDVHPQGIDYNQGTRYLSPNQLERLLAPYNVTSEYCPPDFSKENWAYYGYNGLENVITVFIEITKS